MEIKELQADKWQKILTTSSAAKDGEGALPAVVFFGASWCSNCHVMRPIFEVLAEKYGARADFYAIDAGKEAALAEKYDILSLPVILIFKKGVEVGRLEGIMSAKKLEEGMSAVLDSSI